MNSKQKIEAMFNHHEAPVPQVELAVDEVIVLRFLQKPLPEGLLSSSRLIDLDWEDRVEFSKLVGLDALGIYHWNTYGSLEDNTRPVLRHISQIIERDDLSKLTLPEYTFEDLYKQVKCAQSAMGDNDLSLFVEFAICLEYALADMGFENLSVKLYDDPGFVEEVLDRYTNYTINLIDIYNRMNEIDFLWIGDDLAYRSGPFFSPNMLRRYIFPFFEKAVRRIEKPWIFHSDGDITPLMEDILAWKPTGLHPIEQGPMDIYRVKR